PCRTGLIMDAERLGIPCGNGLFMLVAQALRSAERFLDKKLDDSVMETVYKKILCAQKNIVLIGMPGCGKSTVGAGLAELTGRPFIDTDAEIVKKEGRPIPEIFSADGEEYFRIAEFAAVAEAGKKTGVIISTGGGAVMREENREALSQNGTVIYLKRDVASLARDGRPLSADGEAVEKLYRQRKKIYETFASFSIEVDNDIDATVREVMKCISL
ncbi:MAG: shikimate kinase, partial [Clostridia bacterium]|nr:shikimate kinase [Clostridia bacterium]